MICLPRVLSRCLALTLVALPLTTNAVPRAQEVAVAAHPDAYRLGDVARRLGSAPYGLSAVIDAVDGEDDA